MSQKFTVRKRRHQQEDAVEHHTRATIGGSRWPPVVGVGSGWRLLKFPCELYAVQTSSPIGSRSHRPWTMRLFLYRMERICRWLRRQSGEPWAARGGGQESNMATRGRWIVGQHNNWMCNTVYRLWSTDSWLIECFSVLSWLQHYCPLKDMILFKQTTMPYVFSITIWCLELVVWDVLKCLCLIRACCFVSPLDNLWVCFCIVGLNTTVLESLSVMGQDASSVRSKCWGKHEEVGKRATIRVNVISLKRCRV